MECTLCGTDFETDGDEDAIHDPEKCAETLFHQKETLETKLKALTKPDLKLVRALQKLRDLCTDCGADDLDDTEEILTQLAVGSEDNVRALELALTALGG